MSEFYKVVRKVPKLPYFYNTLEHFPNAIFFEDHYILDIETTGLNNCRDIIICLGLLDLKKSIATIWFLENPRKHEKFYKFCRSVVISLMQQGKKIWAYNSLFEETFLRIKGINDLMLYWHGGRAKMDYCYQDIVIHLKNSKILPENIKKQLEEFLKGFNDNDVISGNDVPKLYFYDWLIYGNNEAKMKIINHNYCDLVKEALILYFIALSFTEAMRYLLERFNYYPRIMNKIFRELF